MANVLRNDLAVVDDKSIGTQRNVAADAPGDIGDVPVDVPAPEREMINATGR
jgi:hypothetical protein